MELELFNNLLKSVETILQRNFRRVILVHGLMYLLPSDDRYKYILINFFLALIDVFSPCYEYKNNTFSKSYTTKKKKQNNRSLFNAMSKVKEQKQIFRHNII